MSNGWFFEDGMGLAPETGEVTPTALPEALEPVEYLPPYNQYACYTCGRGTQQCGPLYPNDYRIAFCHPCYNRFVADPKKLNR